MDKQTDSIFVSIKKMLGLEDNYTPFDSDILVHINSALMTLTQLGIGPEEGFIVEDYSTTWGDFLTNKVMLGAVKNYVYTYVKMLFDAPSNSFVMESLKSKLEEMGWRLKVQAESVKTFDFITDNEAARKRGWPGNDVVKESRIGDS
jgi:hypothetical protein